MTNIFLNKGGAGISISRQETIERLDSIIRRLSKLNLYHNAAISALGHEEIAAQLASFQRKARTDVGKLAETVLSCGGVPYNATELEPENHVVEGSDSEILDSLREKEQALQDAVKAESKVRHQLRTQAILLNVETNGKERLNFIQDALRKAEKV